MAATEGRTFVTADDVKTMAPTVLRHRMLLRPEVELQGRTAEDLLDGVLSSVPVDRKSTRLNSSHANISYAVFCLKKKKRKRTHISECNQDEDIVEMSI